MTPLPYQLINKVVEVFNRLGIEYLVGGSIASSYYGVYRLTNDVDFVADIKESHIDSFAAALEGAFYVDSEMIRDAICSRSSFNIIDNDTMFKVDIFIKQNTEWTQNEWKRRQLASIAETENVLALMASPEDTILHKLDWYRLGGRVSDRQWSDLLNVLKVQKEHLDFDYLNHWAKELNLEDLLKEAMDDAYA